MTESALGSQWKTPVIDDSEATVPADGGSNGTATVDNERKLGSLEVTKTVDWNGVEPAGSFEICIEGPSYPAESEDPDACQTIGSGGGVLTWIDLIPGAYTVTETDPGSQWTVTVDDSLAAVPTDGGEGTATVDNEWNVGDLQILKSLSNPNVAPVPATFAIGYVCSIGQGEGTRYTKSGQVNVAPGGAGVTVEDIPMGATCTITEVTPSPISGYTWAAVTYSPQSVEIARNGGTFTVQANNAITGNPCTVNCGPPGPGSLALNKTVTGGPAGYVGPFDIQYSCTNGGPSGTASVTAGVPFVINNIPNGSVCTVSENSLPTAPAGYTWSSQSDSGGTVTISTGKTSSVTVTNGLTPIPVAPAIVPQPAKVVVPAKATIPASVPAGGGYDGPRKDVPMSALILLFAGLVGLVGATARKRMLREE